jgi:hypothetical protein
MTIVYLERWWNQPAIRALVYVGMLVACYLFGEFTNPFIYRDF